jgi:hypothetical protein
MDGKRVHTAREFTRESRIDHAVTFKPALPAEGLRHDIHAEVGFAAGPVPGVTFVPVGFVFDVQIFGRESFAQLFSDEILSSHRAALFTAKQRGQ